MQRSSPETQELRHCDDTNPCQSRRCRLRGPPSSSPMSAAARSATRTTDRGGRDAGAVEVGLPWATRKACPLAARRSSARLDALWRRRRASKGPQSFMTARTKRIPTTIRPMAKYDGQLHSGGRSTFAWDSTATTQPTNRTAPALNGVPPSRYQPFRLWSSPPGGLERGVLNDTLPSLGLGRFAILASRSKNGRAALQGIG